MVPDIAVPSSGRFGFPSLAWATLAATQAAYISEGTPNTQLAQVGDVIDLHLPSDCALAGAGRHLGKAQMGYTLSHE